jgi:hypothetical protein
MMMHRQIGTASGMPPALRIGGIIIIDGEGNKLP